MKKLLHRRDNNVQKSGGYIILISVLIVGTAALSIALSLLITGIDNNSVAAVFQTTKISQHVADACVEVALQKLKNSSAYAGNETLTFPKGESCTIYPILGTGTTNRTVEVAGNASSMIRKVEVKVATTSPQMSLTSWQEVADFY